MSKNDIRNFFKPVSTSSKTKTAASAAECSKNSNASKSTTKKKEKQIKATSIEAKKEKKKKVVVSSSDSDTEKESNVNNKSSSNKRKISNSPLDNKHKTHSKKISTSNVLSDEEDIICATPDQRNVKKKKMLVSSDSDDDIQPTKTKMITSMKEKKEVQLKPVNISDMFSNKVSQSKIELKVDKSPIKEDKKPTTNIKKERKSKKKASTTESSVHGDSDFSKTLMDLDDDDIFLLNEDILNKTIESATLKEDNIKNDKDKDKDEPKSSKKRTLEKKEPTPGKNKKLKLDHTDSGIDDQERHEKKRYCAQLYQNYLNRQGPKNHGSKKLPNGKPDCLANLCFLRTGVLDSLESEEFQELIQKHGGKVVHAVSKKVNYVVAGDEPGPAKMEKARNYKIPIISEDGLLNLILKKSGLPEKYGLAETPNSEDFGISNSFQSGESEEFMDVQNSELEPLIEIDQTNKKIDSKTLNKKSAENEEIVVQKKIEIKEEKSLNTNKINKKIDDNVIDTNMVSLSEKYKPKELKNIIGQQMNNSNMNKLKMWLENWHKNEKLRKLKKIPQPSPWSKTHDGGYYKCALLSGSPGVGKTTTATLVAETLGYEIVEFNASDTRSKNLLQKEVASALTTNNISFEKSSKGNTKRVLLMDEVDGIAGNEDRGGMQELINLIKITKIPIICMCNDRNHQKIKSLSNYCFDLRFEKPKVQQILGFVMSICCKEGIKVNPQVVTQIINGTTCDIRQTLNQISMIANLENEISMEQAQKDATASKKDIVLGPWQVCKMVFNEEDQKKLSLFDKSKLFFYDYSLGPLFVQENYLKVQPNVKGKRIMKHVAAAAEAISMGATIDKKIRESNNWSLLDTQAVYSSVLPGYYMSGNFTAAIDFPSYLGKYSKRVKRKRLINELTMHSRLQISGGALAMNLDYSKSLLTSIITPLKKRGLDGVSEAVDVMKSYQLLRVDLDNLIELCTWSKQKNVMGGIETKVKAAFTRLYNKEVPIFSYSADDGISKKKRNALYNENPLDEETEEIEENDETIETDNLIKSKTSSKTQRKKDSAEPSTSKQKAKPKKPRAKK